jgi:pSer/pThr/pTyr-binding forkhead associated (FHA) protein
MANLILEMVEGTGAGTQVPLQTVIDIGRDPSLQVHLDSDTQVSRRHARVTAQNGVALVEDLGSTNGTYVNEQPISGPRQLNPGDRVRVGLTVFELRSSQQVAARPSAVRPVPQFTAVGNDVLQPVPEQQLAPVPQFSPTAAYSATPPPPPPPPPQPQSPQAGRSVSVIGIPTFRAQETPAGFVPPEVVGDPEAESDYGAVSRLVDTRAKAQRNVAAFAMISAAAMAVIIYFGVT